MEYSNKHFSLALKDIINKKGIIQRKLAAKTNFCFSYFCVLKKRQKHPPIETIEKIAKGLDIPPEYFMEYRINKIVKLLTDRPDLTEEAFEFASSLSRVNKFKVAEDEKEFDKNHNSSNKVNND